jgi:hypothetical protein
MNVLGAVPFRIIAFYRHLFGHRASVAVFSDLAPFEIESARILKISVMIMRKRMMMDETIEEFQFEQTETENCSYITAAEE